MSQKAIFIVIFFLAAFVFMSGCVSQQSTNISNTIESQQPIIQNSPSDKTVTNILPSETPTADRLSINQTTTIPISVPFATSISKYPDLNIANSKHVEAALQQPDNNTFIVTYRGGSDEALCVDMSVSVTDSSGQITTKNIGSKTGKLPLDVGEKMVFTGNYSDKYRVEAIAWFSDGTAFVILDRYR